MNITLASSALQGSIAAIGSKSQAHRLLICASLAEQETALSCRAPSEDIFATARCLMALGAKVDFKEDVFVVTPINRAHLPREAVLNCGESGTTYRLLAPLCCALGINARFFLFGRLSNRPMDMLWDALESHGVTVEGKGSLSPSVSGRLSPGVFEIPGNISSQFISGLLLALPCLAGNSRILVKGSIVSQGYIALTLAALRTFSIDVAPSNSGFSIPGGGRYLSPGSIQVEGDWSNAAFWLCAGAVSGAGVSLFGLDRDSLQGDRAVLNLLKEFGAQADWEEDRVTVRKGALTGIRVNGEHIPDLVPALVVAALFAKGDTFIENAGRLRLKESDRLESICQAIRSVGGKAEAEENRMVIHGAGRLKGGEVDPCNDHRIAMMAAILSVLCKKEVKIKNAEVVKKSYPSFFEDFTGLCGRVIEED